MPRDLDTYFADAAAQSYRVPKTDTVNAVSQTKAETIAIKKAQKEKEVSNLVSSFGSGAGQTVSGLGTIAGLVTGDMDNAVTRAGDRATEYWNDRKPVEVLDAEKRRSEAVNAADGQWGKFGAAISETVTDPSLMLSLGASQIPNLIPGAAAGRAATIAGAGMKAAGGIGIGAGNLLHSADSAGETYDTLTNTT